MKLNLPNRLTVGRMFTIPVYLFLMLVPVLSYPWNSIVPAFIFLAASITDTIDGSIARKRNMVTDFGKFLDPVVDKLMVFAAFLGLLTMISDDIIYARITAAAAFIVMIREISVTSLRMIASNKSGIVIAANKVGKAKTTAETIFICCALLEPVIFGDFLSFLGFFAFLAEYRVLTYLSMAFMVVMAVWSGVVYFKAYLPVIDPRK